MTSKTPIEPFHSGNRHNDLIANIASINEEINQYEQFNNDLASLEDQHSKQLSLLENLKHDYNKKLDDLSVYTRRISRLGDDVKVLKSQAEAEVKKIDEIKMGLDTELSFLKAGIALSTESKPGNPDRIGLPEMFKLGGLAAAFLLCAAILIYFLSSVRKESSIQELEKLRSELISAQTTQAQLQSALPGLQGEIRSLQAENSRIKGENAELQRQLEKAKADLDKINKPSSAPAIKKPKNIR